MKVQSACHVGGATLPNPCSADSLICVLDRRTAEATQIGKSALHRSRYAAPLGVRVARHRFGWTPTEVRELTSSRRPL